MFSLRQRLTLWYTFVLLIAMIMFAVAVFLGGAWQLQRTTDIELQQMARQLTGPLLRDEELLVVDTSYRLLTPDGQVVRAAGLPTRRIPVNPTALSEALQGRIWTETIRTSPIPDSASDNSNRRAPFFMPAVRIMSVPLGRPVRYILQVGKLEADVLRLRSLLITMLLGGLLLGLPLAALGGWWLAGRALTPIRTMTDAASRIEARNLAERLPQPPRNYELNQLAHTFNQLLDRLEAAFQRERRFIMDVSHDLRTPLALVKSSIGVALNRPRSTDELQRTLTEIDSQIDRISSLLDATLTLSRADSGQLVNSCAPLNLSELLTDLGETSGPYAQEERNQVLTCDIAPNLWVNGDRDYLTRLFLNLIDNAMQYAPARGMIRIAATAEDAQVVVIVEDNGPGIADADLQHIFDRFYRADKARTGSDRDHFGLGLSIAQALAYAHGGDLTAESTLGQGSRFIVRLPRVASGA